MKKFLDGLLQKVFVVDPMDRPVIAQEENAPQQNIVVSELMKQIKDMKAIAGDDLNIALNDKNYYQLIKMIDDEIKQHNEDFEIYLEKLEESSIQNQN